MIGPLSAPNGDTTPIIDDKLCVKSKITRDKRAPRESGVISRAHQHGGTNKLLLLVVCGCNSANAVFFYFAPARTVGRWEKSENPTGGFAANEKAADGTNHLFVVARQRMIKFHRAAESWNEKCKSAGPEKVFLDPAKFASAGTICWVQMQEAKLTCRDT